MNDMQVKGHTNKEESAMIEMVEIFKQDHAIVTSLLQKYNDGRSEKQKIWSVGDKTKDGKIISFHKSEAGHWYAITDTPSEWQKNNGFSNRWSWIFQLEVEEKTYSINEVLHFIKNKDHVSALSIIDRYFEQKNTTITRSWLPRVPGVTERIILYVGDDTFVFKHRSFLFLKWWTLS